MDDPNLRTFDRHCIEGVCHCDWRLTIKDCEESHAMWIANIVNIAISALSMLIASGLFSHRVFIKGHKIWGTAVPGAGILRPKPIDDMLLLIVIFNLLRIITSVVLVTDIGSGNYIARSFLYEIPWFFSLAGLTLYFIGIAQTIAQSRSALGWLPQPRTIDVFGLFFIFTPLVVGQSFTIAAGTIAHEKLFLAETLIRINYFLWFIWTGGIGVAVMFASLRLIRILRNHHKKFQQAKTYEAVKAGIYKIQLTAFSYVVCLYAFAALLLVYVVLRNNIISNTKGSIFLGVVWTILAGVTTLIAEFAILIRPVNSEKNAALRSKSLSDNKTHSNHLPHHTGPVDQIHMSSFDATAEGTFDGDAIERAIQAKDAEWLARREQMKNKPLMENGLGNEIPYNKRRTSDNSSQVELTSYESHQ